MTSNKIEQAERRELAGSNTTSTYFHQSQIAEALDAPGGRYREKETITGSELVPQYPRLPASSPWASDGVGVEQPLGIDVNAMEPTGNAHEIEAGLVLAAGTVPGSEKLAEVAPLVASSPADVETPRPISSVEERLAEILPKIAVPIAAPPKRRRV
jgi:hypothetical protein